MGSGTLIPAFGRILNEEKVASIDVCILHHQSDSHCKTIFGGRVFDSFSRRTLTKFSHGGKMSVWLKFAQAVLAVLGFFLALGNGNKKEEKVDTPPATAHTGPTVADYLARFVLGFILVILGIALGVALWRLNYEFFVGIATFILSVLLMLFSGKAAGNFFVRLIVGIVLGVLLWGIDEYAYVGVSTVVLSILLMVILARGEHVFLAFLGGIVLGVLLWYLDELVYVDGSVLVLSLGTMLAFPVPPLTTPRISIPRPRMPRWQWRKTTVTEVKETEKPAGINLEKEKTTMTEKVEPIEADFRVIPEGGTA